MIALQGPNMRRFFSKNTLLYTLAIAFAVFITIKVQRIDRSVREMTHASGKNFFPAHIECPLDQDPQWNLQVTPSQLAFVNIITQQPFRYLNKGVQAYAFLSQDGEYVVKFFQHHRLREKTFKDHPIEYIFNGSFREKMAAKKNLKNELFASTKLAFEMIPEESGIIYAHLNRTEDQLRGIRIVDANGTAHKIRPDGVSFILQRKAVYILPTITSLMKKGDVAAAKARLDQIFSLLLSLAQKGIVDGDYALIRNNNIGFAKDRCIYIDTGHIYHNPTLNVKEQMEYEFGTRLAPLYEWLAFTYPELAQYYEEQRHKILTSL